MHFKIFLRMFLCVLVFVFLISGSALGHGMWEEHGEEGVKLCNIPCAQNSHDAISNGAGGMIDAWADTRNGNSNIYITTIDQDGYPNWILNGTPVCMSSYTQQNHDIIPDGSGGAIIAWQDDRSSNQGIYAQRIRNNGLEAWLSTGLPVCTASDCHSFPKLASDGSNGAIIIWNDNRTDCGVYGQRVDNNGNTLWALNGNKLLAYILDNPMDVIQDDADGIIFIGRTNLIGTESLIAQRVGSLGTKVWGDHGIVVSNMIDHSINPRIVSDGAGGGIIIWTYYETDYYIMAQRISDQGVLMWTSNMVTSNYNFSNKFDIIADGSNGAFIVWEDNIGSISAQHLNSTGQKLWAEDGIVAAKCNIIRQPYVVLDDIGGIIIAWQDLFQGICSNRIDLAGNPFWGEQGITIAEVGGSVTERSYPQIIADSVGGMIVAYLVKDQGSSGKRLYAQRIVKPQPIITSFEPPAYPPVIADNIVIKGHFFMDDKGVMQSIRLTRDGHSRILGTDIQVIDGSTLTCDFDLTSAEVGQWQVSANDSLEQKAITDNVVFEIHPPYTPTATSTTTPTPTFFAPLNKHSVIAFPNPARDEVHFTWQNSQADKVEVSIFNITGEQVALIEDHCTTNTLTWNARNVAPGIYFYRICLWVNGQYITFSAKKIALIQ